MTIHLLPDEVASQIAAGEVVERPASVVKELVENALDAGARFIDIKILDAGQRLIEVSDDGRGIPFDEIPLAVTRHATSKLSQAEDLFAIGTLGFRGEALASIGSISRMTVISCLKQAPHGGKILVDGGRIGQNQSAGAPTGTTVRVEDLFFNVPARLKFLKKETTERSTIDRLVTRYAVAYPHVRFRLRQEDRITVQSSGNGNQREALTVLFGADIARQMLAVNFEEADFRLKGFVSPTGISRANRRNITFFVNGRWVQDAALNAALLRAYHTLLMVGRYPLAALFLEIPPDQVDVNVHPAKAEVRFRQRDEVFRGVQRAVRRALLAHAPVTDMQPASTPWSNNGAENGRDSSFWNSLPHSGGTGRGAASFAQSSQRDGFSSQPLLSGGAVPLLRLLGQIGAVYLVAEGPDGLYLIDQHAAHERVLFERFLEQQNSSSSSQTLLQPENIELSTTEAQTLTDQLPVVEKLGFRIELFGPNTFRVRAIPSLLGKMDPKMAVRVLLDDFEEDETPLQQHIEQKIIARVCKSAAVKAGQILSPIEQQALLADLENCQSPRTCPHGRPTMLHLSVDLLERQFGRSGAR